MQLYFGLLCNANLKGFLSGKIYSSRTGTKFLCTPGINCYSCPGATLSCPMGSLQGAFSKGVSTIAYVGGIILLYAIIFGRTICGWLCPFGLIQDLLHKIPSPKLKKGKLTHLLSYIKYGILVFFALGIPIFYAIRHVPLPAFCKYICPAGTLEGGLVLLSYKVNSSLFSALGGLFTWKALLMVSILAGCIFIYRVFCRFLCPLGVIYGLFNKISFLGVKLDDSKCIHCNLCVTHCKVDIHQVADRECIQCGDCIEVCPTNAISWKGSALFVKANDIPEQKPSRKKRTTQVISALVMLGILISVFAYYWVSTPTLDVQAAPSGSMVGNRLPDMALPVLTSSGLSEQTINPAALGKITVINFWGTWCPSCLTELPYFDQIAKDYADFVTVVAIHSDADAQYAPDYIAQHFANSPIVFAKDIATDALDAYYTQLGGLGSYPHTVIIDENGIVLTNLPGTLHYDDLQAIIEKALA